ncbi:MAG: DnaJ domain-containing protein, partial [candidate division Zixibacteria bacterium]|nr:DnaJ domain-containing protein [candidate division Zixibacteria bacterium]NIX57332.1 DnaJ domain-containing protein [candidate division Zixibacteria bacterium]
MFSRQIRKSSDPVGFCLKLILLWLASAQGSISDTHFGLMEKVFNRKTSRREIRVLIKYLQQSPVESLFSACEFLRGALSPEGKRHLMHIIISVSTAYQEPTPSGQHILWFLADLLDIFPGDFEPLYEKAAGSLPSDPGNPGSSVWWQHREAGTGAGGQNAMVSPGSMTPEAARSVLGVGSGATRSEIREAYRRLVSIHHPDLFADLGPDSVKAANAVMYRINEAYEVLLK